jgi:signal transduction histidine kinase
VTPKRVFVVAAAAVAYGAAAVVLPKSGSPATFYAATSPAARAADLSAGLGLMAAGLFAFRRRDGLLAVVAGMLWFGADWEGWAGGPTLVRSLGALAAPLFLAVTLHLALALTRGARSRVERAAIAGGYMLAALAIVMRAVLGNPLLDLYCWRNCLANSFLITSSTGLTHAVGVALNATLLALAIAVAVFGARRSPVAPVVGAAWATYASVLLVQPLEDPQRDLFRALFFALAASSVALACTVMWQSTRHRRMKTQLARLADDLRRAPQPGQLQPALVAALGDPLLSVRYRVPQESFVDSEGRRSPEPAPGRAQTPIVRDGETIAVVVHDPALLDVPDLGAEIGAAARLAVDNERLRAQALAQLHELRASRARVVDAGDRARRELERGLHDGAQQRLLALSFELQLARAEAEAAGETDAAALLADAAAQAGHGLEDLRILAHGIFPAVLAEAGLSAALATLADAAPLPVELGELAETRFTAEVEAAAYAVATAAIADASARHATFVRFSVTPLAGRLVLEAADDGDAREGPLVDVGDRVGALAGIADFGPTALKAEIPCA